MTMTKYGNLCKYALGCCAGTLALLAVLISLLLVVPLPPLEEQEMPAHRSQQQQQQYGTASTERKDDVSTATTKINNKRSVPKLEFANELPTGIVSQKPASFFRQLQAKIDQDDPVTRCQRYGYTYNQDTPPSRRIFLGSLIAEEPWELLEMVAAESFGLYAGMVLVESNRTQIFVPRPLRRATNEAKRRIQQLFGLNDASQLQMPVYVNENPKFTGIRREHAQRQLILEGWKDLGMTSLDIGIIADMDETFSRDFLRAIQTCDNIPQLQYNQHSCHTSKVKLAASSLVFETSPECLTAKRGWYHPDLVLGACIEGIGDLTRHGLAERQGPRRARGHGRGCSHDFSKLPPIHPLWNAADFRMLCGAQALNLDPTQSNYTGFHFHNFFTSLNATRLKYHTYGHAMKARKAFASALEDMGQNDLQLLAHCMREEMEPAEQKWKRVPGGLNSMPPHLPVYFHDADYVQRRHAWVQQQVRHDDVMVQQLQQQIIQQQQQQQQGTQQQLLPETIHDTITNG